MEIGIRSPRRSTMSTSNLFSFILLHVLLFLKPIQRCSASSNCLEQGSWITNNISTNSTILSSPGNVFKLGFFTPDGSTGKNWYLGIWYGTNTSMKIIVWVANRDSPLHKSNASLIIHETNIQLLNKTGEICWSSDPGSTYPNSVVHYSNIPPKSIQSAYGGNKTQDVPRINTTKLCLGDGGNLTLEPTDPLKARWQSFDHPTDTFLPGMVANNSILTSWQNQRSPAAGHFILQLSLVLTDIITMNKTETYWENTDPPENQIHKKLSDLLSGEKTAHILTRLVMNSTGQVQLWERDNSAGWSLKWFEPKDRCSLYSVCGDFGSCNSYNRLLCKCLPGFMPVDPPNWDAGDHSSGCVSISPSCGRKTDVDNIFLTLPMMNVGRWNSEISAVDCMTECLQDCDCIAYFNDNANLTGTGTDSNCKLWKSTKLTGLQEEYAGGLTLNVRTKHSVIALTSRDCDPCGTYSIPYPLSTAANCGDPSYFHFHCNTKTGQVDFSTPSGRFNVTSINQKAETVVIQVGPANSCDSKTLDSMIMSNMKSSLFNVRNCTVVSNQPLMDIYQPFIEVEIGWQSPPEPACNSSSECGDWKHTTCKPTKGGKRRCLCASNFDWDGLNLKCIKKVVPVKVLIACVAAALAIVLLVVLVFIYRKRTTTQETGSVELMGDNSEPIDLPFFDWENILSATNRFADENKLGTGGFGSVYRGSLPDGQEIAVKRLSSVSVQGAEEFRTEVVLIAKLQHRNLVRLLGYCVKADEKILVYEYMPNGSLDSCLFDETLSGNLDWEKRFDIITGIARGLLYLHQDSRLRIIHRDLKPSNVLLDDDLNPKISDFGIARIVEGKQTESNTKRVVGTYGYMSPEYAYEGIFSVKSDVFSFGVVVLETISGRRNSRIFIYEHGLSLLGYAWKLWSEDRGMELPELTLRKSCNISQVLKCIQIALLCIQEDPNDRPTMSTVVLMLSSENASLPPPKQPAFGTRKPPLETTSSSSAVDMSLNDMSLSVSTVGR